jgi:NADP-dependent 3-hydroxy acid dehydrogenase YdfG
MILTSRVALVKSARRGREHQKPQVNDNVGSMISRAVFVCGAGYAAPQRDLIKFSRSLMLEVRDHNIRVITICPGSVDTAFSQSSKEPSRSDTILHSEDIADAVEVALKLPDSAKVSEIDIRRANPQ